MANVNDTLTGVADIAGTGIQQQTNTTDTSNDSPNDMAEQSFVMPDAVTDKLPVYSPDEFAHVTSGYTTAFANPLAANPGNPSDTRANVIKYAESFLGTPYVWGGAAPGGFDCSGLVQYVTNKFGLKLPRISQQQMNSGAHVSLAQLQPGDLVIMHGGEHVGLYAGGGKIVEAPHTGAQVRVRSLGKNEQIYGVHLVYPGESKDTVSHFKAANGSVAGYTPQARVHSLNGESAANARAIVQVGRSMGASERDIQIALATAWTESAMQTSAVGDNGEAIGLFQQHGSWGTYNQRTNAMASAYAFYKALLQQRNRNSMTPWQAAQSVQRSAYSDGSNYRANWQQGLTFYGLYGGS
jgi:cell wall-associated NlpC family hydrolase